MEIGNDQEKVLYRARRSAWKYLPYLCTAFLIVPGLYFLYRKYALELRIYEDRMVMNRGIFATDMRILFVSDIRAIDVKQSFFQTLLGYGDIFIATSGTAGYEYIARGFSQPLHIKNIVLELRRRIIEGDDEAPQEKDRK